MKFVFSAATVLVALSGHVQVSADTCPDYSRFTSTDIPTMTLDPSSLITGSIAPYSYDKDSPNYGVGPAKYAGFLTIPMYNGGKNHLDDVVCDYSGSDTLIEGCKVAEAQLAYDCASKTLCVAAYLTHDFVGSKWINGITTIETGANWIRFYEYGANKHSRYDAGPDGTESEPGKFIYDLDVTDDGTASGDLSRLGWEQCFTGVEASEITDKWVQVHFNIDGNTISTGKGTGANGAILCTSLAQCSGSSSGPCDGKSAGDQCDALVGGSGCCYSDGTDLQCSTDPEQCPALCTVEECQARLGNPSACNQWQCGAEGCEQNPDLSQVDDVCGSDTDNQCTESDKKCNVDGSCSARNLPDTTICSTGECCSGICESSGTCSDPSQCPETCPWVWTVNGVAQTTSEYVYLFPTGADTCKPVATDVPTLSVTATDCEGEEYAANLVAGTVHEEDNASTCKRFSRTFATPSPNCNGISGTFEIFYEYTDSSGPTLVIGDETQECDASDIAIIGEPTGVAVATGTCSEDVPTYSNFMAGGNSCTQVNTVTWSVTDDCGNEATTTQTITVVDTKPPNVYAPEDVTYECVENNQAAPAEDTFAATASDTCGAATLTGASVSGPSKADFCGDGKQYTITYTAEDDCLNEGSDTQLYTLVDTAAPVFGTLQPLEFECSEHNYDGAKKPTGFPAVSAADACNGDVAATSAISDASQSNYCGSGRTHTITWSAQDDCGLQSQETQTYTVTDTTPPSFDSTPVAKEFQCNDPCVDLTTTDGVQLSAICETAALTASDACQDPALPDVGVGYEDCVEAHPSLPGATITRTFTATDPCGLVATSAQTIQVIDTCDGTVSDAFSGSPINVDIGVENVPGGGVKITVAETDGLLIGDLRGIFFQLSPPADFVGDFATYVAASDKSSGNLKFVGDYVGRVVCDVDGVDKVANDVIMKGGGNSMPVYTCGVELGSMGKSRDDIPETSFTITSSNDQPFSTDFFSGPGGAEPYFGVRLTSVGAEGGNREDSSKVYGQISCCRFPRGDGSCSGGDGGDGGDGGGDGPEPAPECPTECTENPACPSARRGLGSSFWTK